MCVLLLWGASEGGGATFQDTLSPISNQ
jgi:hypothetical protein